MISESDSEKLVHAAEQVCLAYRQVDKEGQKIGSTTTQDKERINDLSKAFTALGGTVKKDFLSAISDSIKGGDSFASAFERIKNSLEDFAIKFAILNPVENILFGSNVASFGDRGGLKDILPAKGKGGLFGDLLGGLADFIGARAGGGPVTPGAPYLVGEKGPELFVPNAAGRITPNASGSAPISITMNIATQDAASFRASQNQIAASMMDAARRAQRIR